MSANFLNIFAQSPFKPLQEHMTMVQDCTSALLAFFEAVFQEDWVKAEQLQQHIVALEHKGDSKKKDIRLSLPNSLFMPVSRSDLLQLLKAQDRIANRAKDVAGVVFGRKMTFPEGVIPAYRELLQASTQAIRQSGLAVGAFDELLETGFKGHEAELVEQMIAKLDALEDNSDRAQVLAREQLMAIEKTLPPVDVMFLYQILEMTGVLADKAQHVGHCLQLLLAR